MNIPRHFLASPESSDQLGSISRWMSGLIWTIHIDGEVKRNVNVHLKKGNAKRDRRRAIEEAWNLKQLVQKVEKRF